MLLAVYLKTFKKVDYLQNSKQKIEVQINIFWYKIFIKFNFEWVCLFY